jgi:ABC-type multidrug transport system fused ATPase/permease subunit
MDYKEEIHAINAKLSEIVTSIELIKERRINDKESAEKLSDKLDKITVAVNRLNLTIEKTEGIQKGKSTVMKWVWSIFGGLIFVWVLWVSASITKVTS